MLFRILIPVILLFASIGLISAQESNTSGAPGTTRGTIVSPQNGTHVKPDSWIDFVYNSMGEYSVTSYNISIWLWCSDPTLGLFTNHATGVSIGRFSLSSSSNTDPPLPPPPSTIYIPDFSHGVTGFPIGWGGGVNQSDAPLWLSVLEEYGGEGSSFGAKVAYTSNLLVYNSTLSISA
ncbi:hypothetical protein FRC14_003340 [Serendipita sp. 396]|nr:hypothetical protein FRC14_003340 [Serendipita sp. 396]KAG8788271.1 hypothetical protein FRC15_005151 [Serendipita sp. 397]KAG8803506.1 hypothetical protein FRC16_004914 [Serendipita sp. 398]KAG8817081.1 hypothetical protein FRC19_011632 [Serendipita sp. 401]KAG8826671.1 hypothetical protein FRC18_010001 [Serendipita sp. 400]KAG8874558.1 hypothetical protein FRC20_005681 [Serendipita sp. 405]KAG9052796.1 hypothetical protein FS842_009230 [Serendipita sp. 407]